MMCSTYWHYSGLCSAHFIRTVVLKEILIGEINKILSYVRENEDEFVKTAESNAQESQMNELKKAKSTLKQTERRIAEIDNLFTKLYEDNVSGKIPDASFELMSKKFESEQETLMATVSELRTR